MKGDEIKKEKFLVLVLVLLLVVALSCDKCLAIEQVRFHSETNGYSFAIPEGWIQIPEDIVQQTYRKAVSAKTTSIIKYEAIFQLASQESWLEHPLIIIIVVKYSNLGLSRRPLPNEFVDIVKALTGYDVTGVKKVFTNQRIKGAITDINIGKAVVDKDNRRYKLISEIERTDLKYDKYDIVGYFGKDIIVQISFNCHNSSDWDKFKVNRDYIFGSLKFDSPPAYTIPFVANPQRQPFWEKISVDVAIYGILALVIILIGLVGSIFIVKKRNDFKDEQKQ